MNSTKKWCTCFRLLDSLFMYIDAPTFIQKTQTWRVLSLVSCKSIFLVGTSIQNAPLCDESVKCRKSIQSNQTIEELQFCKSQSLFVSGLYTGYNICSKYCFEDACQSIWVLSQIPKFVKSTKLLWSLTSIWNILVFF